MNEFVPEPGPRLAAIILAAGCCRRHPAGNKLLLPFRGSTVVRSVVEGALEAGIDEVFVVTGHESDRIRGALEGLGISLVQNPAFRRGMGNSLSAGVRAAGGMFAGYVVFLGDMPAISPETIRLLRSRFLEDHNPPASIIRPYYAGRAGHPVLLGNAYRSEILALDHDAGARVVVCRHTDHLVRMHIDDRGVITDIDTVEDYVRLKGNT